MFELGSYPLVRSGRFTSRNNSRAMTTRRHFLQSIGFATAGMTFLPAYMRAAAPVKFDRVRVGVIGCGLRAQEHLRECTLRPDVDVIALADPDPLMIARSQRTLRNGGRKEAVVYGKGNEDYLNLLKRDDIDAVFICSPWEWHVPQGIAALEAGKIVGMEVCGGMNIQECWDIVQASERTGVPVMALENVCYRRDVMAVLNMVRQGLFGEMMHLEGGYQHDLRGVKFNDGKSPYDSGVEFGEKGFSEARWRTQHSIHRNGDLYPTHGIGPVANYIDINRGNRFTHLTSMATKARGLHEYIVKHPKGGPDHPNANVEFRLGDVVTTMIRTSSGETVTLFHDTNLPRPYSLGFRVQGTKGIWMDVNQSIYLEGKSAKSHQWEKAEPYLQAFDHPLWKKYEQDATGAGHGGMDFFLLHAFIECAKENAPAVIDVYDAATWMAITPLSEESIAMGSQPVAFPDFTRGRWINRQPVFALDDRY